MCIYYIWWLDLPSQPVKVVTHSLTPSQLTHSGALPRGGVWGSEPPTIGPNLLEIFTKILTKWLSECYWRRNCTLKLLLLVLLTYIALPFARDRHSGALYNSEHVFYIDIFCTIIHSHVIQWIHIYNDNQSWTIILHSTRWEPLLLWDFVMDPGILFFQWSLAGVSATSHQTGRHHLPTQVATFPGHTHHQLTSVEFQDWGSNLRPLRPADSKLTALTVRPRGTLFNVNSFQCEQEVQNCCFIIMYWHWY